MEIKWLELLVAGFLGLSVSMGFIWLILRSSRLSGFDGRAREAHHTHQVPVPRFGGVALAGAMVGVVLFFKGCLNSDFLGNSEEWLIISTSLAMFALGLWDDLFRLGARRKLLGQLLIASITYFCGVGISHFRVPFVDHIIDLGILAWPITVFWLVAMTNLINLIDGVDGLAGGIALMLMVLLLYVSSQVGTVSIVIAGMIGALLGFLRFNFPPARIYMGDGGAYFLGYLIGCTTIVTSQKGTIFAGLVAPLFVLALPIIDTSLAILRRGVRGLPLFRPDRKHIHHRLLALGHSRRKVVLGLYGFTAFFLLLGFAIFCLHGQYFPLLAGIGVVVVLLAAGKFSFSRGWFSVGRVLGNSLMSRQDVQYAMCLSRWLALEGTRAESVDNLATDVVYIARKLGFSSVKIRLEDGEKTWILMSGNQNHAGHFRHELPGHHNCFLELGIGHLSPATVDFNEIESNFSILAELLAEGWVKAVVDWNRVNQLPVRFQNPVEQLPIVETRPVMRASFT